MVSHLCLTLCNPMDCSLPGFSVGFPCKNTGPFHAMPSSRGSSSPRDQTCISCVFALADGFFTPSITWKAGVVSHFFFFLTNIRFKELLLMLISLYMFPHRSKWAFLVYFQKWNCVVEQGSPASEPLTGLLATEPHSGRWAADEWEKLCLYSQLLPNTLRSSQTPPNPGKIVSRETCQWFLKGTK